MAAKGRLRGCRRSRCVGAEHTEVAGRAHLGRRERALIRQVYVEAWRRRYTLVFCLGTEVGVVGAGRARVLRLYRRACFAPVACGALIRGLEVYVGDHSRVVAEVASWALQTVALDLVELEGAGGARSCSHRFLWALLANVAEGRRVGWPLVGSVNSRRTCLTVVTLSTVSLGHGRRNQVGQVDCMRVFAGRGWSALSQQLRHLGVLVGAWEAYGATTNSFAR